MSLSGKSRISVAICTYNGERFLAAQLESIAQQTRLPDELVVCDDGSTDQTLSIIRSFAASASGTSALLPILKLPFAAAPGS